MRPMEWLLHRILLPRRSLLIFWRSCRCRCRCRRCCRCVVVVVVVFVVVVDVGIVDGAVFVSALSCLNGSILHVCVGRRKRCWCCYCSQRCIRCFGTNGYALVLSSLWPSFAINLVFSSVFSFLLSYLSSFVSGLRSCVVLCCVEPCRAVLCYVVLSCLVSSRLVLYCLVLSCLALSCSILCCLVLSARKWLRRRPLRYCLWSNHQRVDWIRCIRTDESRSFSRRI